MKKIMAILALTTLTVGCESTTVQPMQIEYQPFDANSSYAMNIANQTVLTKPEKWGFDTMESPLKDFTKEEVDTLKTELTRENSGGDVSILLGGLSILTGDFTGIISVVGGTAANMANSNHLAAKPSFIIELDAGDFSSIEEAEIFISETVNLAAEKTLARYGVIQKRASPYFLLADIKTPEGDVIHVGMLEYLGKERGEILTPRNISLTGEKGNYLTQGILKSGSNDGGYVIAPPTNIFYSVKRGLSLSVEDFFKEFSSHLPDGFYVYIPSFPKWYEPSERRSYQNYTEIVPAIYTQGKKHEFLKG